MKKIISVFLMITILMGTSLMNVSAEPPAVAQRNDLVTLKNFEDASQKENLSVDELKALGIKVNSGYENAKFSIVDLSGENDDALKNLGKVLCYDAQSVEGESESEIQFDFVDGAYTYSAEEYLIIEYDFYVADHDTSHKFKSNAFGEIGLNPINLWDRGDAGYQYEAVWAGLQSGNFYGVNMTGSTWGNRIKIIYDIKNTNLVYATFYGAELGQSYQVKGENKKITADCSMVAKTGLPFANKNGLGKIYIDNVHVYTIPKNKFVSSQPAKNAVNVFPTQRTVTLNFYNEISDVAGLTITKNGETVAQSKYTASVDSTNKKLVRIIFNNPLEYDSEYSIDFSAIKDIDGFIGVAGDADISFETVAAPTITGELKVSKGYDNSYVSGNIYAQQFGNAELKLTNSGSETKKVKILFVINNSDGVFNDIQVVNTQVEASKVKTVYTGFAIPNVSSGTVHAYIWNENDVPYVENISCVIQ